MALTFKPKRQRKLSIPKLLALAVVALVLLLGTNAFSATEKERNKLKDQIGRYQRFAVEKDPSVWFVFDTATGQSRICTPFTFRSGSGNFIWEEHPPICHPWSEDDREKYGK